MAHDAFQIDRALARDFAPTGTLRAALNMGNPILAASNTAREVPAGVTIDLTRELARRLDVPAAFLQHKTAADALAAVLAGEADIGFMAIDPGRSAGIHFTAAYVEIVGSYAVPHDSPIRSNDEVDRAGLDVVVGDGSAYDLFLARHLEHARLVRVPLSEQVVQDMMQGGYPVGAGVRQQLEADARVIPGVRVLDGGFMVIRQAAIVPAQRSASAQAAFDAFIEWAKASGFVRDALQRHGIEGAQIAPAA